MAQLVSQWTCRTGDVRLEFYTKPIGNDKTELMAKLFQKNARKEFIDSGIVVSEKEMTVETENIHALMRSIPQKSFMLNQLTHAQKMAIMNSLSTRNISVARGFHSGSLVIHALP
jgi:hypothetical protein